jgi:LPS export ABC transporter protein LptC
MQECGVGLVSLKQLGERWTFAAPLLKRSDISAEDLAPVLAALGLDASEVIAAQHLNNGPHWLGLLIDSVDSLLALVGGLYVAARTVVALTPTPKDNRTLDQLTIYLPLILFALLALGSWWLVRSMPELLPPGSDKQLRKDPDYQLEKFTVKSFDNTGRMTREIAGQSATHFPASQELHIQGIRIFAENEVGTRVQAQARQGVSQEAVQQVTLSGDVLAVRAADRHGPLGAAAGQRRGRLHHRP